MRSDAQSRLLALTQARMSTHTHRIFLLSPPLAKAVHLGLERWLLGTHLRRMTVEKLVISCLLLGLKTFFSYFPSLLHERLKRAAPRDPCLLWWHDSVRPCLTCALGMFYQELQSLRRSAEEAWARWYRADKVWRTLDACQQDCAFRWRLTW